MKHLLIIFTIVLSFNFGIAQDFDFGKISKAELEEKFHPKDSSANAAILYRNETVSFTYSQSDGFMQDKDLVIRIKIYNKEGLNWASEKIYLYKGNSASKEVLRGLKGYTYNLVNGEVEKDKLKSDGVFEEKATELYSINSFTFPNVKVGSVIEYRYTIRSPFIQIDDVDLQFNIPVNKIDVKISTPQFYSYNKRLNPKSFFIPTYSESKVDRTLSIKHKTKKRTNVGSGSSISRNDTKYYDNVITLSETNIPSLSAESFSGSINNYKAQLSLELQARLSLNGVVEKSFATSWNKVSETIYDSPNFGEQLNRTSIFNEDISAVLQGVEDDFQKAFLIEAFVKSKVKWNGDYGIYAQKGIRSAYKDGEGNVSDINLLVVAMLRSQGVNANPVLISTRNNGLPLFPTRQGFNYVICSVQKGDQYLLIDATERFCTNNVLPIRALNWQGRLIEDKKVSRWINIKPNKNSIESTMLNVKINDDFTISGNVAKHLTSYVAYLYRKNYATITEEDHIKAIEKDKGDLEISELNFENAKNATQPIKVSYKYELSDGVDEVGDKLYLSPLMFFATKENPFKLEERQYPIDFVIPTSDKYMVNIMLPEGYIVESLPQSEAMAFKDSEVMFKYLLEQNGNYLQLKVQLDINNPMILPKDYKDFKAFYSKIIEKQKEQIVLTKS